MTSASPPRKPLPKPPKPLPTPLLAGSLLDAMRAQAGEGTRIGVLLIDELDGTANTHTDAQRQVLAAGKELELPVFVVEISLHPGAGKLVVMGYNTNQCVRLTAVGGFEKPGNTGRRHRGAVQREYTVMTCQAVLRGGEAAWKHAPGVEFYTEL